MGIFPIEGSLLRRMGMLLAEQHDEWQAAERAHFSQSSMARRWGEDGPPARLRGSAMA